ncbi:MAG: hypothetical protein ACREOI_31615 [bacterium]
MKSTGPAIAKSAIALRILAYLEEHPDARDSLEGIVEWWLLEQEIKNHTIVVREALDELVTEGLIVEHQGESLRALFSMNPQKREEIQRLLQIEGMIK